VTHETLLYAITNIAHYLTKAGRVFVIGAGGGRDVLSALVFDQRAVVAVEMNRAIIEAVNDVFGDLTGHLDRHAKVRFVNDEARSYLARSRDRFDLIQISLIDTWAATAAGAFVLSENTLYTTDAWKLFLDRLTPEGILSVSRWHGRPVPAEMYKVTALATNSLRGSGIPNPRQHLIVVATGLRAGEAADAPGVATLLMKRTPFTEAEVTTIENLAEKMHFDVMLTPRAAADRAFVSLADERAIDEFVATFTNGDLSSPTDDRPFFFKMDARLLNGLFRVVGSLTLAFIVVPVFLKAEPRVLGDNVGLSVAFAAMGLGFMLVEIAQMQRLILTSQTYRSASSFYNAGNIEKDPTNVFLWRYPVRRVEGEVIRDLILSASGQINLEAGGPPFFGFLFDLTKSYLLSFILFTLALVISAFLILLARPPQKQAK